MAGLRQIGFIQDISKIIAKKKRVISECKTLLPFDDGDGITLDQGCRNVLITGQTGSGKTESVIRPIIYNLVQKGLGGIIFDIKGTLREDVYKIAKLCDRQDDVVEFGSSEEANRTNIFSGLEIHESRMILDYLAMDEGDHDVNMAWHIKGAKVCIDIYKMLDIISKIEPDCEFSKAFTPTLFFIDKILTYGYLRWGLYEFFKSQIQIIKMSESMKPFHYLVREGEELIAEIERNKFHLLGISPINENETSSQQSIWQLEKISDKLSFFRHTRNLIEKFSATDKNSVPMNFNDLMYDQTKIILIHFSIDCGRTGEILSNIIKERYYQAVLKYGYAKNQYTFMVADEFQYIANVKRSRFLNDMDIFSISRQFNIINVIATQNISSLLANRNMNAVYSLLGNCTTKIFLQNSDINTKKWAAQFFDTNADIGKLERGEALIETINEDGIQSTSMIRLNTMYNYLDKQMKQIYINLSRRRKTKELPYKIGSSGLPLVMDEQIFYCYKRFIKDNSDSFSKSSRYSTRTTKTAIDDLCDGLEARRNISLSNEPYWIDLSQKDAEKTNNPQSKDDGKKKDDSGTGTKGRDAKGTGGSDTDKNAPKKLDEKAKKEDEEEYYVECDPEMPQEEYDKMMAAHDKFLETHKQLYFE